MRMRNLRKTTCFQPGLKIDEGRPPIGDLTGPAGCHPSQGLSHGFELQGQRYGLTKSLLSDLLLHAKLDLELLV